MNKKTILLIGAGQLGSRHLQSLVKLNNSVHLIVVDPSQAALKTSEERAREIDGWDRHTFSYQKSLKNLPPLDFAVIATSANIRRKVVEELLSIGTVKKILLEKVLFQSAKDCIDMGVLFKKKDIDVWTNAPRRMWPFYNQLKQELKNERILSLKQGGSNWGLACNSYHFLDLFSFLTDDANISLSSDLLNRKPIESKRAGFKEATGTLCGKFSNGTVFSISDYQDKALASNLIIETNKRIFMIDELHHSIISISGQPLPHELIFEVKYQSDLTHLVAKDIFSSGSCKLTPYEEASLLHQEMLNTFAVCFPQSKEGDLICPIT